MPSTIEHPSDTPPAPSHKAVVIGLYGVSGSGKTTLLANLKAVLGDRDFAFYDGSSTIAAIVPDGMDRFNSLNEEEKEYWRRLAIDRIGKECEYRKKVGIVAGHCMFWSEEENAPHSVWTENDLNVFTHILYLDCPAEVVFQRRQDDTDKSRPFLSIEDLGEWQRQEKEELRRLCRQNGILFSHVNSSDSVAARMKKITDFKHHNEQYNMACVEKKLDTIFAGQDGVETVLVLDADKTLATDDAGKAFWTKASVDGGDPLKALFSSPLQHSYTAFRQAVLMCEEAVDDEKYESFCGEVASAITMHPEFVSLLHRAAEEKHVGALVVTCGLRHVWEKVLEREGFSGSVSVLGGGRIADGFVVTAQVKATVVSRLQDVYHAYVWAFGDSPLDIEMLCKANRAVVVTGEEKSRSKTMDVKLRAAIDGGLRATQVLLPPHASARLDTGTLPLIQLTESDFVNSIFCRHRPQVRHATDKTAAKLLMAATRDAAVAGPALREAHQRVGWYLGTEFVADLIGLEEYQIQHVQGNPTNGHRLACEAQTSIAALMRGGEPMAFGINDAFPLAMFLHANNPQDIKHHHLKEQGTVLLVDSVVNSGKTVLEFVDHVRNLNNSIRIVVVAGVVQSKFVSEHSLATLGQHGNVDLVALRVSGNKFTGTGTTDTGNRLFNTTHLD